MGLNERKRIFGHVRPAKIQISCAFSFIRICARRILASKDAKFLLADNEDSNQTARMRRLI